MRSSSLGVLADDGLLTGPPSNDNGPLSCSETGLRADFLRNSVNGTTEITMATLEVRHYMTPVAIAIGSEENLERAVQVMRETRIRYLPVIANGEAVGLLSARDVGFLERFLSREGSASPTVAEFLDREFCRVQPNSSVADTARVMIDGKLASAMVMEDERVVGVFTVTEALRALADLTQHVPSMAPGAPRVDLEILKLLVQVAWADGEVDAEETDYILGLARKVGASEREMVELEHSLSRDKRLPAPDFSLLRQDPEAVLRAVKGLVASDGFVVDDEEEVIEQIRELLVR
jgi:acetoin utilization protein AcuB